VERVKPDKPAKADKAQNKQSRRQQEKRVGLSIVLSIEALTKGKKYKIYMDERLACCIVQRAELSH